jgi:hypothetical protein
MTLDFSQHALARVRQRGLCEDDVEVVVQAGTPLDADSVFLLDSDVAREVGKRKREIAVLERLRGCRVVIAGEEMVVTVYRPSPKTEKKLLRGTHRQRHGRVASYGSLTVEGGRKIL